MMHCNHCSGNQETKFEGKCTKIKNSIYDVVSGKDTFVKTTEEIAKYAGCEFDDAGEFRTGMVEMRLPPLTEPPPAADDTAINFKLWKMACHTFKKQTKAQC